MGAIINNILLFLLLIPCIGYAQDVSQEQTDFVNNFMIEVKNHNKKSIIKAMDKSYRKEQIKFLGGDKEQFVNELFGGSSYINNEWTNFSIDEIIRIEVAEIVQMNDEKYEYIFRVRSSDKDALCSLLLSRNKNKFGFIGAMG